jgi:hypothetical protein
MAPPMDRHSLSEEGLLPPEETSQDSREWTLFGRRILLYQRQNQWKVVSLVAALVLCSVLVFVVVVFTTVVRSSNSFLLLAACCLSFDTDGLGVYTESMRKRNVVLMISDGMSSESDDQS